MKLYHRPTLITHMHTITADPIGDSNPLLNPRGAQVHRLNQIQENRRNVSVYSRILDERTRVEVEHESTQRASTQREQSQNSQFMSIQPLPQLHLSRLQMEANRRHRLNELVNLVDSDSDMEINPHIPGNAFTRRPAGTQHVTDVIDLDSEESETEEYNNLPNRPSSSQSSAQSRVSNTQSHTTKSENLIVISESDSDHEKIR
jgi:hypothetical protein